MKHPVRAHRKPEAASPRCQARFRGCSGLRGWCPGCGRRLVEFQICAAWPDWTELPDVGTRNYRCPVLRTTAEASALPPSKLLTRKAS